MKIISTEIHEIAIPLRITFNHALASHRTVQSVVVRIVGDDGNAGYGECVPRSYVTGETLESVRNALATREFPAWIGQSFQSFEDVIDRLAASLSGLSRNTHAAHCAMELATLDLAGRCFGLSSGKAIGPVITPETTYSAIISADDPAVVRSQCTYYAKFGATTIKLKVGGNLQQDLANLRIAREILGWDCVILVDANTAWTTDETLNRIEQFRPFNLAGIEQPLSTRDIAGLSRITRHSPIPIILDESLVSMEDARRLSESGACHAFNIRISKCGGLLNSMRIRDFAYTANLGVMLGAQVGETALLSAAGRHFATRSAGIIHAEGSYGHFLLEKDIAVQDITLGHGGKAPALANPGIGVDVDPAVLDFFTVAKNLYTSLR